MIEYNLNDDKSVATIQLSRIDKSNAMNAEFIQSFISMLEQLATIKTLKICIIRSATKHFCVGADIAWMQSALNLSAEDNIKDVALLADLLQKLYQFPAVTIAVAHGAVFGGGLGLLACADFVLAADGAKFCFSEIKLGLMPATIAPYVSQKISLQIMKRLMFTAELFTADQALQWGFVDEVLDADKLDKALQTWCDRLLPFSKQALIEGKAMFEELAAFDDILILSTMQRLARMRQSIDGQEGLKAFLEKRSPKWKDDV
jgi:methylglutaconyl-CoA hydratase